jgi:fatty-acyl-CoA synthase
MFGNTCIALAGLLKGATLIMPCRVFEPSKILKAIKKERGTAIYGSPSMFIALLEHLDFDAESWQSLTKGTIGGAPCPMELMRKLVEDIGLSDVTVGYGITEASSWITMTQKDDPIEKRVSTIGKPLPCCRVKIVDPSEGTSLAPSEQGELCTKGYLMQGYHKQRAATSAAIDRDGWFHTGDLGKMDAQGYVRLTGRLKEVIVRQGVEILPAEVEEVFYELAEVSEAQVFGFSHSEKGQRVAAWIKLKDGCHITVDRLKAHARERLDAAKLPDDLEIVRGFPMTRSGKVQKFRMAEQAAEKHGKE